MARGGRSGSLFVTFCGDEREVAPGESLSFGRDAELVVDAENVYLHRILGVFVALDSVWVLQNVGRHINLTVRDRNGPSRIELAPSERALLTFEEFVVSFSAGPCPYQIEGALSVAPPIEAIGLGPSDTLEYGTVRLNEEQRLMVVALAEPLLRGNSRWPADLPSSKEIAVRLGWTASKLNRKLDYLCSRLAEQGVPGMQGALGRHAMGRRQRLAEHLVERGLVTVRDLSLLEESS